MAGIAALHELIRYRLAIRREVTEPPSARSRILCRVLDHKLNVRGGTGHKRLGLAKDFVVFLGRCVAPMQGGDDRAVRERKLAFPVGLNRYKAS